MKKEAYEREAQERLERLEKELLAIKEAEWVGEHVLGEHVLGEHVLAEPVLSIILVMCLLIGHAQRHAQHMCSSSCCLMQFLSIRRTELYSTL